MEPWHLVTLSALLLGAPLAGCNQSTAVPGAKAVPELSALALADSADLVPPSPPGNLTWSQTGMTVVLTWAPSTDDVGVVGYDLYYGSYCVGTFAGTSLALIGFRAGTPYAFTVEARDAAGNLSQASNEATVLLDRPKDTTPPTAPTNLAVTGVTSTSVSLRWTASTDDVGVVIYQVYAGTVLAGTVTGPAASVRGLQPNTPYGFTVTALDASDNTSPASASLMVTTLPVADTAPLDAPTDLTVSDVTATSAVLTWNAAIDSVGVEGYVLYDGATVVATTSGASAALAGLTPDTTYDFTVRADNASGAVSAASNEVVLTTTGDILTITAGSGGTTIPAPGTYGYGAGGTVTVTASPASGYVFAGWTGAACGTDNPVSVTIGGGETLGATFSAIPIQIDAGGPTAGAFLADADYSGGSPASSASAVDLSLLAGAVPPQEVFQTARYGEFSYTVPNLAPGAAYGVTLYFAESQVTIAGQRSFDVLLNGADVLAAFDVFAAGGGQNVAVARAFNATADGAGQATIQLTGSSVEPPMVSGISLTRSSVPSFDPSYWNDSDFTGLNNCYNYVNNKRTDTFAQPGRATGSYCLSGYSDCMTAETVAANAARDGLTQLPDGEDCPSDMAKMALVIRPGHDYHWYRRDTSGFWSHKPGGAHATNVDNSGNVIGDPRSADRGTYTDFVGFFCQSSSAAQGQGSANIR